MADRDEEFDRESPGEEDRDLMDDGDELAVEACPRCGEDIYEGADRCRYCGDWISDADRTGARPGRLWMIVLVVILLMLMIVFGLAW
ncbi:MAG: zinc ribbon domain-containing protein [Phycisphaerae bacterium]